MDRIKIKLCGFLPVWVAKHEKTKVVRLAKELREQGYRICEVCESLEELGYVELVNK